LQRPQRRTARSRLLKIAKVD
jgi:hypothetical protein